jgi:DNA-binding response OmpR family regulator
MLSDRVESGDTDESGPIIADTCITKPFNGQHMLARSRAPLGARQQQAERRQF